MFASQNRDGIAQRRSLGTDFCKCILRHMAEVQGVRRQPLLTAVCVLLSAHFAIAYNTLTSAMVPFHTYKDLDGDGGPFAYRMLPALLWKAAVVLVSPFHRRFPRLRLPYLNRPFTSQEDWFVVLLTFAAMLGTLLVARRLLRSIDSRRGFEWMALGMGYAAYFDTILVLNRNLYYPYDIAALFLYLAGLSGLSGATYRFHAGSNSRFCE